MVASSSALIISPMALWVSYVIISLLFAISFSLELRLSAKKYHLNFNSSLPVNGTITRKEPSWEVALHFVDVWVGPTNTHLKLTLDTGTAITWIASDGLCSNTPCGYSRGYRRQPSKRNQVNCNSIFCQDLLNYRDPSCTADRGCQASIVYADNKSVKIILIKDILTFDYSEDSSLATFGYGISSNVERDDDGVLGMGQNLSLSIAKQLGFSGMFSYCLPPYHSRSSSTLVFDDSDFPYDYTIMALLQSKAFPYLYYLPIRGISIGDMTLPIPGMTSDGRSGGMIIDTGATLTQLTPSTFESFIAIFERQIKSSIKRKTLVKQLNYLHCYDLEDDVLFPKVAMVFKNGFQLELPTDNILFDGDRYGFCLAFLPAGTPWNIFGNYQQQTFRFALDVNGHMFGVKSTPEC